MDVSTQAQREQENLSFLLFLFSLDPPITLVKEFESRSQELISSRVPPRIYLENMAYQGFLYSVMWTPGINHPSKNALNKVMHLKMYLR